MSGHLLASQIFGHRLRAGAMDQVFSDDARVATWVVVESALAQAQGELGVIPADAAKNIGHVTSTTTFDLESLAADTEASAHSIMAFIRQVRRTVGEDGEYLHWGVTTQDIIDTSAMLQYRRGLAMVARDLSALLTRLAQLAETHALTPVAGRTHGQHAVPISFGLKVAGWVDELSRQGERLLQLAPRALVGNMAGAAGSMSAMGDVGEQVQDRVLEILGLGVPQTSWHSARDRTAEIVAWIGMLAGTIARISNELYGLQRTEAAEVFEGRDVRDVGSSTMPQKANPSHTEFSVAASRLAMGQVSTGLSFMVQENERDVREWMVEWKVVPEQFLLISGALDNLFRALDGMVVDTERMRRNLELTNGQILAEAAMMRLATRIGRQQAHEHLRTISATAKDRRMSLRDALQLDPIWQEHGDDTVLDLNYLGRSEQIVTTVVRRSREWAAQLAVAAGDLAAAEPDNLRRLLRNAGVADPA
jgi:3-carboxy-cis,cis-muconate cycloisomerase